MSTKDNRRIVTSGRAGMTSAAIALAISAALASSAHADLYSSAIVHYTFDNIGEGNIVADSGTAGINLSIGGTTNSAGGATIVPGARSWTGNGLYIPDFDNTPNSDSGVFLTPATPGGDTALNTTRDTPFSLATWFQKSAAGNGMFLASKQESSGAFKGWVFQVTRAGILQAIFRNANSAAERIIVTSVDPISDTSWHHLGMSFQYDEADATRGLRMYVDGQSVAVTATASNVGMAGDDRDLATAAPFTISGRNGGQVDDGGSLDEFAVWKSILSPADFASFVTAPVTVKSWAATGSALWSDANAWSPAGAPSSTDPIKFGNAITSDATVTIDAGGVVASTAVDTTHKYTIALAGPTAFKAGNLNIASGTLAMAAGGTNTLRASAITIAATGATLDLADNALIVDYTGTSPIADLEAAIVAGKVMSSNAGNKRIGYGEATAVLGAGGGTFGGESVTGPAVVARLTFAGDANLDLKVNFSDLVTLAQNYNHPTGNVWTQGDFDYNGAVNFSDLVLLAQNYNQNGNPSLTVGSAQFQADWALAQSLVPEPTSLAMIGLGAAVLRRRRA